MQGNKHFRLALWCSFVFANCNCDWLKWITWLILANHSCCLQKQINIEVQVEKLYWPIWFWYFLSCMNSFTYRRFQSRFKISSYCDSGRRPNFHVKNGWCRWRGSIHISDKIRWPKWRFSKSIWSDSQWSNLFPELLIDSPGK